MPTDEVMLRAPVASVSLLVLSQLTDSERGGQDGRIDLEGAILQELVVQDRIEQGTETIRGLRGQLRDLLDEFGGGLAERTGDSRKEDEQADGRSQRRREVQAPAHP